MALRISKTRFKDGLPETQESNDMFALAYHDALTGIGNRRLFEADVEEALASIARGESSAAKDEQASSAASDQAEGPAAIILFLDLDRFKIVNDTLGHAAGDGLLRLVSDRMHSLLRDGDTLARLGGDEFAVMLTAPCDVEMAAALAAQTIELIQRAYLLDGNIIHVGASIGIAVAPQDGTSMTQLFRSADLALYHSKASGRGVFHFFKPVMEEKALKRRELEIDLRKALVLRQFEIHYQPQIDAEAQTIIGLEGLIRWRHPRRGILKAEDFLPLAEEIGIAPAIGEWMLKTACKEAKRWPDSVTMSVNISPHLFETQKFAASVERALTSAHLSGSRFEIDVTEDILLRNGQAIVETLGALRKLGVSVAMDGFGTGLASMSQLVNFPFDKIKIDPSLSTLQGEGGKNRAIVRAVSALGESLGISTLAEGVHTSEHLAEVRADGCGSLQGFYYSPPVPASELHSLFLSLSSTNSKFQQLDQEGIYEQSRVQTAVLQP